jgi:hypothetical protein
MATHKVDFKKVYRQLYTARSDPVMVEAPELPFLMADGAGGPETAGYRAAVEALYGVAYAVRFALKDGADALEYRVMPLQGRWWNADGGKAAAADRSLWRWSMMLLQPPQATAELVEQAATKVRRSRPAAAVDAVRLDRLAEGRCAQVRHTGPYREEGPTIDRLHAFIRAQGCVVAGRHHEIYLSDPARTAPDRLRTIIRYPVAARQRN